MIDLKNVISLIEIKFLRKVSSIMREDGSDKCWLVIFDKERRYIGDILEIDNIIFVFRLKSIHQSF